MTYTLRTCWRSGEIQLRIYKLTTNCEFANILIMEKQLFFDRITRADGTSEFEDFLATLPVKDRAKLLSVINKTEQLGMQVAIQQQWVKKLRDGICELRSRQGGNIQRALYFRKLGNEYVITHGFTKKTDKTPDREIDHALSAMKAYVEVMKK